MPARKARFLTAARDDVVGLPTLNLRRRALRIVADLMSGASLGRPLEDRPMGDLSDCFKVYFDDREGRPRYRLVYRMVDDAIVVVTVVAVIAVGARDNLAVYREALRRLGRD
ncbi:MAG: hypothetical protein FWD74_05455 [Actinomycetia bacterium]|nr:hypothetical protein [Actinomycetes bacterium]